MGCRKRLSLRLKGLKAGNLCALPALFAPSLNSNLKHHHEMNLKNFSSEYSPKSESWNNKLTGPGNVLSC